MYDDHALLLESSVFEQAWYDNVERLLFLQFRNGSIYCYSDVPSVVWLYFFNAESAGNFYSTRIQGSFESARLDGDSEFLYRRLSYSESNTEPLHEYEVNMTFKVPASSASEALTLVDPKRGDLLVSFRITPADSI